MLQIKLISFTKSVGNRQTNSETSKKKKPTVVQFSMLALTSGLNAAIVTEFTHFQDRLFNNIQIFKYV